MDREPQYSLELDRHMGQVLAEMHGYIQAGEKFIAPLYVVAPERESAQIRRFHMENSDEMNFPEILFDAVHVQIMQFVDQNPDTQFAIIGYSRMENDQHRFFVEGYSEFTEGGFVVSHSFSGSGMDWKPDMTDLRMDHFLYHNPLLGILNRKGRLHSGFELKKKK